MLLNPFSQQCSQCSGVSAKPACHEWVDLADTFQDEDDFMISGAEICVKPCGPLVSFEEQYCQVLTLLRCYVINVFNFITFKEMDPSAYLFNYQKFVNSADETRDYFSWFLENHDFETDAELGKLS